MKKIFVSFLISILLTQPIYASVIQDNTTNCTEDLKNSINTKLDLIPDEIMNQFYDVGGSITFKNSISYQGKDVKGIFYAGTNAIEVVNEELSYHYLAHEIGHFIYLKAELTNEDKNNLNTLYSVFGMYGAPFTSQEETFAELYAFTKTGYGGYYLNSKDISLIKKIEKSVSDQYINKNTWIYENNNWYLINKNNQKLTGWQKVNGIWYYLNEEGILLINTTTPDGFKVNSDGAWIKDS